MELLWPLLLYVILAALSHKFPPEQKGDSKFKCSSSGMECLVNTDDVNILHMDLWRHSTTILYLFFVP